MSRDEPERPEHGGAQAAPASAGKPQRVRCPGCRGTGRWVNHVQRLVDECRVCHGKGWVRPSLLRWRAKQRAAHVAKHRAAHAKRRAAHVAGLAAARTAGDSYRAVFGFRRAFAHRVGGEAEAQVMVEFLRDSAGWSAFYAALLDELSTRGDLSEKQITAIKAGRAKIAARKAALTEQNGALPAQQVAALFAAFDDVSGTAVRPRLHYIDRQIQISKAPASGRYAGCLYVQHAGQYAGRIDPVRGYLPTSEAEADTDLTESVRQIAADPAGQMAANGHATGLCGCCSHKLCDDESRKRGIGPVCAKRWGF